MDDSDMVGANINLCNILSGDVESKLKPSDFFLLGLKKASNGLVKACPYNVKFSILNTNLTLI